MKKYYYTIIKSPNIVVYDSRSNSTGNSYFDSTDLMAADCVKVARENNWLTDEYIPISYTEIINS